MLFPFASVFLGALPLAGSPFSKEDARPNVILIVADDLGYGDLGSYGCKDIKTPNIDLLAKQGVRFTQFYANGPECSPTRAALLTGRYQQRVGGLECAIGAGNVGRYDEAAWLADNHELGLPAEHCLLPREMKKAGYATAIIGKWHLGYEKKFRPDQQGFDYSFGPIGFGGDYFYHVEQDPIGQNDFKGGHNLAMNGKEVFRDGEYITSLITTEALGWLKKQKRGKPFFLYLPYTAPHDPYQGPNDSIGRPLQGDEWKNKSRAKYIEMVEALDQEIGHLMECIEKMEKGRETIFVFFSDNGGTGIANNGILSGYKGQVHEGGIRVPCIVKWPGKITPNTVSHQSAVSMDITRSILEVAGIPTGQMHLDGFNMINHVVSNQADFSRTLFWRLKRGSRIRKAVRDGDLKYIEEIDKGEVVTRQLFNLKEDPSEKNNLFSSDNDTAEKLQQKITAWEKEVSAPRLQDFYKVKTP